MNKLFKKIGAVLVGAAMMVGAGVAVGASQTNKPIAAQAAAATHDLFKINNVSEWETSAGGYSDTVWRSGNNQFKRCQNNNKQWNYVALGGKNLSNAEGYIASTAATTYETAKVTVGVHLYKSNGNLTINSVHLKVWETASLIDDAYTFSDLYDNVTIPVTDTTNAYYNSTLSGSFSFDVEPSDSIGGPWKSGVFFQLVLDLSADSSKDLVSADRNWKGLNQRFCP